MSPVEPSFEMWATLVLTALAIVAYASERLSIELTALGVIGALLLLFALGPLRDGAEPLLGPAEILQGFASPALIAVGALLVVGQAMISTGALEILARLLVWLSGGSFRRAVSLSLVGIVLVSGFLNNTPIVVMFIPILRSMSERYSQPASTVMMPVSFAAILGGMLTLIGTSTNLLVSGELAKLGERPLQFFDLTVPGTVLATVGCLYVLLLTRLLPHRDPSPGLDTAEGKQFIAELDIAPGSPLIGERSQSGMFPKLAGVTVRLVQRGDRSFLPPFEDLELQAGDVLIVAATRKVLTDILAANPGHLLTTLHAGGDARSRDPTELMLAEAMVRPASRMAGQTLEFTSFSARSRCLVLGVQRRARMLRLRLSELRLEPGDVLLLLGRRQAIERLRADPDVLLMEWSASEMPLVTKAPLAGAIFLAMVVPAALDLVPIVTAAVLAVLALIAVGCLNVRQALRAIDPQIVMIIASAVALGTALEATGGATYLAELVLDAMSGASPAAILSVFFLVVAIMTNVLSNNACGVLFTPIAVELAGRLGVDVFPFALAVAFAASCSFATPIGYQTNLLVMAPGHYRFADFLIAGTPLVFLVWLAFSLFVPWYYGV